MGHDVLPLGDPRLRAVCEEVKDTGDPGFRAGRRRLEAALEAFRADHGFGRGIAAPQLGMPSRFVSVNFGRGTVTLVNPTITKRSEDTFTMWDDCMCFPHLLVRLRRFSSVSVRFEDVDGRLRDWDDLPRAESELLQHELDHLDGVLAIDHALDARSIIYREAFDADPEYFRRQVDYVIGATV